MTPPETCLPVERQQLIADLTNHAEGSTATECVLAIIDIREFRELNHSFGISSGDAILTEIGSRLSTLKIKSSAHYYLGNDEFAILFKAQTNPGVTLVHIESILNLFKQPFEFADHQIKVTVNCGIANNFPGPNSASQLLFDSEVALKQAKVSNRLYVWLDQEAGQRSSRSKWNLLNSLHQAIEDDALSLYWQPKVPAVPFDLQENPSLSGHCGAEGLIRWETADQGILAPKITLPLIEHLGSEIALIEWMLSSTLKQLSAADEFLGRSADTADLITSASINIPPALSIIDELHTLIDEALKIWDIAPTRLTLEITEETLISEKERVFDTLSKVRDLGVRISIDDFGTGYSSLSYFKHIPADELKIDKTFILNMLQSEADRKIVELIIDIAHTFDLRVIAEGVENEETLQLLKELGCDYMQGFYFSRPVPHADYLEWIKSNRMLYQSASDNQ